MGWVITNKLLARTGLHEGGQEIYEGNILEVPAGRRYMVEFKVGAFAGVPVKKTPGRRGRVQRDWKPLSYLPSRMKVIGNIYENPSCSPQWLLPSRVARTADRRSASAAVA